MASFFARLCMPAITATGCSLLGIGAYYPRFRSHGTNAKTDSQVDIPTFSAETDWDSVELVVVFLKDILYVGLFTLILIP